MEVKSLDSLVAWGLQCSVDSRNIGHPDTVWHNFGVHCGASGRLGFLVLTLPLGIQGMTPRRSGRPSLGLHEGVRPQGLACREQEYSSLSFLASSRRLINKVN